MKYKVGDKVRVREWGDMAKEFGVYGDGFVVVLSDGCFFRPMRKYCGKTVTITRAEINHYHVDDDYWHFTDEMFKPAADTTLIIEHHGHTTVAHIGKTYGVARCNPDDKYDAMTGDILAVQRLYAKKAPKKKIIVSHGRTTYGVIGTPTVYRDTNAGKTLNIGDCVDVVWGRAMTIHSFMANDGEDFVIGLKGLPQEDFVKIVKVDGDKAIRDRGFKVVSE